MKALKEEQGVIVGGKESSLVDEQAQGSSERGHFCETANTVAHDASQSICVCLL
jgi:hypothetical protein